MPDRPNPQPFLAVLGRLNAIVEERLAATHDLLEHITEVVRENTEEVGVLRDTIDEFRELVEWAIHNDCLGEIFHTASQVSEIDTDEQPPTGDATIATITDSSPGQGSLF